MEKKMSMVDITKKDVESMSNEKLIENIEWESKHLLNMNYGYRSIALNNLSILNNEFKKRNLWSVLDKGYK
jgi:hypothetical protein